MSPRPAAPRIASINACVITSPSECPASPRGCSKRTPPSTSGTPSSNACASTPRPTRSSAIERYLPSLTPVEQRDRVVAGATEERACAVEVAPDQRGNVRVGRNGDRDFALAAQGEEVGIRVQLADGLAKAARGNLDRDTGPGDRIDHAPMELTLDRPRRALPEHLDQVGVRERIEEAAARGRRKRFEIAAPRRL